MSNEAYQECVKAKCFINRPVNCHQLVLCYSGNSHDAVHIYRDDARTCQLKLYTACSCIMVTTQEINWNIFFVVYLYVKCADL